MPPQKCWKTPSQAAKPRQTGAEPCEVQELALDGALFVEAGAAVQAGVVKLVDTPDLGSGGASHGGSSPSARTSQPA